MSLKTFNTISINLRTIKNIGDLELALEDFFYLKSKNPNRNLELSFNISSDIKTKVDSLLFSTYNLLEETSCIEDKRIEYKIFIKKEVIKEEEEKIKVKVKESLSELLQSLLINS